MLSLNSVAPDFQAVDQDGRTHKLSDYLGKWVLVYFYPKDDTPGCTKEACGIRDSFDFLSKHLVVFGVSADSVKSHQKFAKKYNLPFSLLSDPDKQIINEYQAWGEKKFMGRTYDGILRVSYLINPKGKIAKVYEQVKPEEHAGEIVEEMKVKQ